MGPRTWDVPAEDIPQLLHPGCAGLLVAGPLVARDSGGHVHTDFLPARGGRRLVGWALRTVADTGGGTVTVWPSGATVMQTGVAFLIGRYIRGEREWAGDRDLAVVTVGVAPGPEDLDVAVTPVPHRMRVETCSRTVDYTAWELLPGA